MRVDEVGDLPFDEYADALAVVNALAQVNKRRLDNDEPTIVL